MYPWYFPRAPTLSPLSNFLSLVEPSFHLWNLTGPQQSVVSYSTAEWFRRKLERGHVQPGFKRTSRSQWLAQGILLWRPSDQETTGQTMPQSKKVSRPRTICLDLKRTVVVASLEEVECGSSFRSPRCTAQQSHKDSCATKGKKTERIQNKLSHPLAWCQ